MDTQSKNNSFLPLFIGAIGVVYGDIGTSPLYALREAVLQVADNGVFLRDDIFGILSLIVWSLMAIVTLKYVLFLLRLDNEGEGGTLSLMALARRNVGDKNLVLLLLGVLGAALFYGDAMITPAISILSAVEGLKVVTPAFEPYILPITFFIIFVLFMVQKKGTASISALFGPVTAVWFAAIAAAGLVHIADHPEILLALNPYYALTFMAGHGMTGLMVLGAVFLAVTGAEALYADLGHFGRRPIQAAWISFVFPALVINYFGQGALLLTNPVALESPFFLLVSPSMLLPMVGLATAATIIASQAVITGAYSMTKQAINLGLLPRLRMMHTSHTESGQIYMPQVNFLLLLSVLLLTGVFKSSGNLASAYGVSVTGTMVITTLLAFLVVWKIMKKPLWLALAITAPLLFIESVFLSANLMKVVNGGWVPLFVALLLSTVMLTWVRGSYILKLVSKKQDIPIYEFMETLAVARDGVREVPGTAVYLTTYPTIMPPAMMQNMRHNQILHKVNLILTVRTDTKPYVGDDMRITAADLAPGFIQVIVTYGFMQLPNLQREILTLQKMLREKIDDASLSLYLSRRSLRAEGRYGMPLWQDVLYIWLYKNAAEPVDYYRLPTKKVIEIGRQVMI